MPSGIPESVILLPLCRFAGPSPFSATLEGEPRSHRATCRCALVSRAPRHTPRRLIIPNFLWIPVQGLPASSTGHEVEPEPTGGREGTVKTDRAEWRAGTP